ncbi:fatty acid desaturase family protein [Planctomonas psychrotolerans]|uniref:fatty acid desaturase family protein n=1 Tax=Planctomonas psychrotolerans TaxID=2528712 RepID=UPI0012396EBE|nr:acyl-CoA desaturase [Planctomonas psychrotolerans]
MTTLDSAVPVPQPVSERAPERAPHRSRPGTAREASEFTELAHRITSAGLLRRRYGYYWSKLAVVLLLHVAAVVLFVRIGDSWWQLGTAVLFAVLYTQTAFLGHDAAHRQIFVSGKWNDWISLVLANLLVGLSYGWWQHKHTRHHANPNKRGSDPDIELPVLSLTPEQVSRRRSRLTGWVLAHQGAFFFPILFLEGLSLHASSIRRVLAREPLKRRGWEIAFLTIRIGGFLALVFWVLSPGVAVAFLGVQLGVFGFYMGCTFAPNHKGMPLVPASMRLDFLRRQVMMSRNIRGNRVLDVLMGGLNYQIEHHLFPSMPRVHLRRAAPMVAAYCADRDIPYAATGLFESYGIVLRYINRVGLGERDPFDCPLIAQRRSI